MIKRIRDELRTVYHDPPGERFRRYHRRRRDTGSYLRRGILIAVGLSLVIFGLATTFIPPIPGITLLMIGAAILAQESLLMAKLMDGCELGIRRLFGRRRRG